MLKKVISLLLVLCLLGSSVGCGGGNPVVPPNNEESSDEIIYIQDTNLKDNVLAVAGKDEGEALAVLGEKDALGNPIKITGAVYISEQGEAFIIDAGDDGLPTYILDSAGNRVVFTNYTDSTVDVSIYNSNDELIDGPTTITVSPSDLVTLKQLYSSVDLKNKDAEEVIAFVLRWGGFGIGWIVCVAAAISLVPPAIVYACGSALLSTVAKFIIPGDADSLILSEIGLIKCALVSTPWDLVACAGSIMSFIGTIIDMVLPSENPPQVSGTWIMEISITSSGGEPGCICGSLCNNSVLGHSGSYTFDVQQLGSSFYSDSWLPTTISGTINGTSIIFSVIFPDDEEANLCGDYVDFIGQISDNTIIGNFSGRDCIYNCVWAGDFYVDIIYQ